MLTPCTFFFRQHHLFSWLDFRGIGEGLVSIQGVDTHLVRLPSLVLLGGFSDFLFSLG